MTVIETLHLNIKNWKPEDASIERYYSFIHPELDVLDPSVGTFANTVFYSIYTKASDTHIGTCCFYNPNVRAIELGIRIFMPEFWNQGYGGEAVTGMCRFVFEENPNISIVYAKTPMHNIRAIRCYERQGFIQYRQAILDGHAMVFLCRGGGEEQQC